jgi:SAM-dependent methyltransferase
MTAPTRTSAYDQYADEYAAYVATREQDDLVGDPFGILTPLLAQLGDVTGQDVLDAGCGEGYLSRILAARGARVTGVDLSPRLVELAGQKASPGPIEYRVGDLSVPHPELEGHFNAVASFFVLNDVEDHRGFAETLVRPLRPGGRASARVQQPIRLRHTQGARLGLFHDRWGPPVRPVVGRGAGVLLPSHAAAVPGCLPGRRPVPDEDRGRGPPGNGRAAGQRRGDPAGRAATALHGAGLLEAIGQAGRTLMTLRSRCYATSSAKIRSRRRGLRARR